LAREQLKDIIKYLVYNLEKVIFIPSYITPLKGRELEANDKNRF